MMITAAQIRLLPQSIDAFFEIYTARAGNDGCANPVPLRGRKKRRAKRRTAARGGAYGNDGSADPVPPRGRKKTPREAAHGGAQRRPGNDGSADPVPSADAKKRRLKRRTAARAGAPAMTVARAWSPPSADAKKTPPEAAHGGACRRPGNDGSTNPVPPRGRKKRRAKRRTAARAGAPAMTVARTRFPARRHKKRAAAKLTAARFGNVFDY